MQLVRLQSQLVLHLVAASAYSAAAAVVDLPFASYYLYASVSDVVAEKRRRVVLDDDVVAYEKGIDCIQNQQRH